MLRLASLIGAVCTAAFALKTREGRGRESSDAE